ncbi:MAG: class I SAM-dependent methyltransferase [Oscillospiraceae bacterium]|nr:class I SAM-dependent methyltransferase [Oscillospiraceae bacterium]
MRNRHSVPLLDPRLGAAAEMVRPGCVAADIGTGHGHLISYLVASGKCPRGFACDANALPLRTAEAEIARRGLSGKIKTILTDGLSGLEAKGIGDFLILGMGGDLICSIIAGAPWAKCAGLSFILQPMTRPERLRYFLYREGFAVFEEKAVVSGRYVYTVMRAGYTGDAREISGLFAWTGLLEPSEASRRYLLRAASRAKRRAAGLAGANRTEEADFYYDLANEIMEGIG